MSLPTLPHFGMGTAALGNLYAAISDEQAFGAVEAAWQGGIRFFDTAPYYGFGLAETRLGQALQLLDPMQSAILSSKVGRTLLPTGYVPGERHGFVDAAPFEPVFDYSRDAVLRSHEQSLMRLHRDRVNILLAHDIGELTHGEAAERHMRDFLESGYPAMLSLRNAGAIDAVGIGVNEVEVCLYLLERVDLDVILIAGRYSLLDQSAAERLLPVCERKGVKVIVGGPYNSGILASPTAEAKAPHYDYAEPDAALWAKAMEIERICAANGISLSAAALHFPLLGPAVASVIPGMASPVEVAQGLERMHCAIPDALWRGLEERGYINLMNSEETVR
jgi:D-threo-aldose 1-dehydrogenase